MRYSTKWPQYKAWWDRMEIRPGRSGEFINAAERILAGKSRYQVIEKTSGVPWWEIGVIHLREGDLNFSTYLGNGQQLSRVTTIVPRGRGPFSTFEAGAMDALRVDGMVGITQWPIEKALWYEELFNGEGYSLRGLPSPYLWGGTTVQQPGKFVADHVFDAHVWDTQPGCAPVMQMIAKLDPTVIFARES